MNKLLYVLLCITALQADIRSVTLETKVTTLNVGETAELTVMATYSDGGTKEVDTNIEYIITPTDSAEINGTVLTAKKDANVTVQVKVGTIHSNTLTLSIAWEVNGHVLPPEPDKTINDSTLLGVDSNDNGVRDDVERWIYEEYKDKHPVHIDIAMQASRGYKLVLETPERAKEIRPKVDRYKHCQSYYQYYAEYFNESILLTENTVDEYFRSKIYFNTEERYDAYIQYDTLLSGDTYKLPEIESLKDMCDFDANKY